MSLMTTINTERLNTALTDLSGKVENLESAGWWGRRQITNSANTALAVIEDLKKSPTTCHVNKDSIALAKTIRTLYSTYLTSIETNHNELFGKPKVENQFSNIEIVLQKFDELKKLTNPVVPPSQRVRMKMDTDKTNGKT